MSLLKAKAECAGDRNQDREGERMSDFLVEKIARELYRQYWEAEREPEMWAYFDELNPNLQEAWKTPAQQFIANVFCDPEVREWMVGEYVTEWHDHGLIDHPAEYMMEQLFGPVKGTE